MLYPRPYSDRTRCPDCLARVSIEAVKLGRVFSCPSCGKSICVSHRYRHAEDWISGMLGLVVSLLLTRILGVTYWVALLCWLPCTFVVAFLWAYIGIYFWPPRLECAIKRGSVFGLDD